MKRRRVGTLFACSLSLVAGCGFPVSLGQPASSAAKEVEPPRIEVEPAHAAVIAGRAVLIDVRGPLGYQREHATGALLLSVDDIERSPKDALAALPPGKQPILYCT